jgi:hypothetical protein
MTNKERREEYKAYLKLVNAGKVDQEALDHLNAAFGVTADEIHNSIDKWYTEFDDMSTVHKAAALTVLMDDIRDYRDAQEIKANRSSILKQALDLSTITDNIRYIFPE